MLNEETMGVDINKIENDITKIDDNNNNNNNSNNGIEKKKKKKVQFSDKNETIYYEKDESENNYFNFSMNNFNYFECFYNEMYNCDYEEKDFKSEDIHINGQKENNYDEFYEKDITGKENYKQVKKNTFENGLNTSENMKTDNLDIFNLKREKFNHSFNEDCSFEVNDIHTAILNAEEKTSNYSKHYFGYDIEPFNMKNELKEGYIDKYGNYIYNESDNDDVEEAWLKSVDEKDPFSTFSDQKLKTKIHNEINSKYDETNSNINNDMLTVNIYDALYSLCCLLIDKETPIKAMIRYKNDLKLCKNYLNECKLKIEKLNSLSNFQENKISLFNINLNKEENNSNNFHVNYKDQNKKKLLQINIKKKDININQKIESENATLHKENIYMKSKDEIKNKEDMKEHIINEDKIKKDTKDENEIKEDIKNGNETKEDIKNEEVKNEEIKNEEIKSEEVKNKEIKGEEVNNEEIKNEEIKGEEVKNEEIKDEEAKNEVIKNEEIKGEEVKNEEIKGEEVKNEEIKGEEAKNEEIKGEEVNNEEIKGKEVNNEEIKGEEVNNEEIKGEEVNNEEIKGEEAKTEEIKGEEAKNEEIKGEEAKNEEIKGEEVKNEEIKDEEAKNEVIKNDSVVNSLYEKNNGLDENIDKETSMNENSTHSTSEEKADNLINNKDLVNNEKLKELRKLEETYLKIALDYKTIERRFNNLIDLTQKLTNEYKNVYFLTKNEFETLCKKLEEYKENIDIQWQFKWNNDVDNNIYGPFNYYDIYHLISVGIVSAANPIQLRRINNENKVLENIWQMYDAVNYLTFVSNDNIKKKRKLGETNINEAEDTENKNEESANSLDEEDYDILKKKKKKKGLIQISKKKKKSNEEDDSENDDDFESCYEF